MEDERLRRCVISGSSATGREGAGDGDGGTDSGAGRGGERRGATADRGTEGGGGHLSSRVAASQKLQESVFYFLFFGSLLLTVREGSTVDGKSNGQGREATWPSVG